MLFCKKWRIDDFLFRRCGGKQEKEGALFLYARGKGHKVVRLFMTYNLQKIRVLSCNNLKLLSAGAPGKGKYAM
jgi:hypothetical protein